MNEAEAYLVELKYRKQTGASEVELGFVRSQRAASQLDAGIEYAKRIEAANYSLREEHRRQGVPGWAQK